MLKKIPLILVLLFVLFIISGCKSSGMLEVVDFNYPPSFNTITGRVITMNMIVKNTGGTDCVIKSVNSREFWNQENPGLSGMYTQTINLILSPNQEYQLELNPYLWDSDYFMSKDKKFNMYIELNNPKECQLSETIISGYINIKVNNSPIKNSPGSQIVVENKFN